METKKEIKMEEKEKKFVKGIIIAGSFLLVAIFILGLLNPFHIIGAGEKGVVLVWGEVQDKILDEGLNVVTPISTKVIIVDIKTVKEEVITHAASKDLQTVSATIALNYHLNGEKVNALWKEIGKDYKERIIDPAIQESAKAITAQYTAEQLIAKREEVRDGIKALLTEKLGRHYIIVDELNIVNFDFSVSFNQAIEAKVTAEQNALAAKNKLEQVKFEAEQRITTATAEAEAIKIQAQAITQQGGKDYVELKAVEKWDGKLPTTFLPNSTVPFINLQNVR